MRAALAMMAVAAMAACVSPSESQTLSEARTALRTGDYDEAARTYRRILGQNPESVEARRGLVEALATVGLYDEAETAARAGPEPVVLANALGEVLLLRGKTGEAKVAFQQASTSGRRDADGLSADANLADILFQEGAVEEAMARFDRFIDIYNRDGGLSAKDLVAVGRAVHRLARNDPDLFQDALRAFDEAAQADPGWAAPALHAGELFLEKYQSPEAKTEFDAVLATNPRDPRALLGMAKALDFDGAGNVREGAQSVLEINPNHVGARVLLARLSLAREDYDGALAQLHEALAVNPSSLEVLSVLAAAHYMSGDERTFEEVRTRALALSPRYADLDATVADLAVQVRRYQDATERAAAAVAIDSTSWRAWGILGMNELRIGRIEEGRMSLERAFGGDPYNPWFKNSLDLLDTFERFEIRSTEHFELFLHGVEADLLGPYVEAIAEEAYDSLATRYGAEPPIPIRIELFPSHADFSVRTLGEPGLGALGIAFGRVLIMDSPAARQRGDYNWASVLWHELSHAFHLAMTDHRVPRWFSEGLSVHEQRKGRPNWGHQVTIPFLQALSAKRLKKVSELNDGFMHPDYPEQVIFSYYQASLVFQVIEDRHGFAAIRRMLDGYRRGETTEMLFTSVLGTPIEDFDGEFEKYLAERFERPLRGLAELGDLPPANAGPAALEEFVRSHPGDIRARMRLGAVLVRGERYAEAIPHLTEAVRTFPEYGAPDSPYWYLAQAHKALGDTERAAAALARLNALSEANYDALLMEADLLESLGRGQEAAAALGRAVEVFPYDIALHERLAALAAKSGDHATAVRERAAVVALDPVDRAEALYLLAVAHRDAGDRSAARGAVLDALGVAPNYEAALELLLELRAGAPAGGR